MKNFRNSIIALATAATMLVPSVAMAASITAKVEGEVNASNVFAGFYAEDGTLLKTEIGGTAVKVTETETITKPGVAAPKEELTQPRVTAKITENAGVHKLTFAVEAPAGTTVPATCITMSYDNTVVTPAEGETPDSWIAYTDPYQEMEHETIKTKYATQGTRTGVYAVATTTQEVTVSLVEEPTMFLEFYFNVNGEITEDTFKLETEYADGSFLKVLGDPGKEKAIAIGTQYWYGHFLDGVKQADNIDFAGFEVVEAVEPTDKPIVTVADEFVGVGEAGNVHKLVFSVKAPTGSVPATNLTFSFDSADVSAVYDDGTEMYAEDYVTDIGDAFIAAQDVYRSTNNRHAPFNVDEATITEKDGVYTVNVATLQSHSSGFLSLTNKVMFTEFYYVVNEGKEVDADTFAFVGADFNEAEADFAGFPWKAPEPTVEEITKTFTNITINDVEAPAEYANIKIFLWNDYQFAACDPVAGTLNN